MKKLGFIATILCAGLMLASCGQVATVSSLPSSMEQINSEIQSEGSSIQSNADETNEKNKATMLDGALTELEWNSDRSLSPEKILEQKMTSEYFYLQILKDGGSTLYLYDLATGKIRKRLDTSARSGFRIVEDDVFLLEKNMLRKYDSDLDLLSEKACDPTVFEQGNFSIGLSTDVQNIVFLSGAQIAFIYNIASETTVQLDPMGDGSGTSTFYHVAGVAPDIYYFVGNLNGKGISYIAYDMAANAATFVDDRYSAQLEGLWVNPAQHEIVVPLHEDTLDSVPLTQQDGFSQDRKIVFSDKSGGIYVIEFALQDARDLDVLRIVSNRAILFVYFDEVNAPHLALYTIS